MQIDWSPLRTALRDASTNGLPISYWWRDDDTHGPSAKLDRLLALSDEVEAPVHLAIVPARAQTGLRDVLDGRNTIALVHGWAHVNHAPAGEKKAEFGHVRPDALHEAGLGLTRLTALLKSVAPVFVPPWNRIAPEIVAGLSGCGYRGLSTFQPRSVARQHGLAIVNTHIDPIAWRGDRSLACPETLITRTCDLITDKALRDPREPLGFLTHHLVHDEAIWDFTRGFLLEMRDGGAVPWSFDTAASK